MTPIETTGRTVEEAVETGLQQLGLGRAEVDVEVLEEPHSLLGLLGHPARVRLTPHAAGAALEDGATATQVVERILELGRLEATVDSATPDDDQLRVTLAGPDVSIIIGKHGQTLQALQHLVNLVYNRHRAERQRIVLDAEGYRERREATLRAMAQRAAQQAKQTGREVILQPLPAIERRVVHLALQEVPGIETRSMGEEPERRVIVIPD